MQQKIVVNFCEPFSAVVTDNTANLVSHRSDRVLQKLSTHLCCVVVKVTKGERQNKIKFFVFVGWYQCFEGTHHCSRVIIVL